MKYYGTVDNKNYGFYESKFDGSIEITDEYWRSLLDAQNQGKIIIPFDNKVIAVNGEEYSLKDCGWVKLSENEIKANKANIEKSLRISEIENELEELDKKRIRAVAEPSLKDEKETWLEFYNKKIKILRDELANL